MTVSLGATHPLHEAPAALLELVGIIAVGFAALNALLTRKGDLECCHAL